MNLSKYKERISISLFYVLVILLMVFLVTGINCFMNNQDISTEAYTLHSDATWLFGHTEYIKYHDGSQDVKIYPKLSHRYYDSIIYQDIDGDNKVDRIRANAPDYKYNKFSVLLFREYDLQNNQKKFDKADKVLEELIAKYP